MTKRLFSINIAVMATRPVEIGPTGLQTARNIERIRSQHGISQRQLAERLTELGRPTPGTALSKIERGERRVDVDDLAAIAVALGVSPSTLLLPPVADDTTTTRVTGAGDVSTAAAWDWADGIRPLIPVSGDDGPLAHAIRARPEGRRTDHIPAPTPRNGGGGTSLPGNLTRPELIKLLDNLKETLERG